MSIKGESASFLSIAAIDFGIIVDLALLYIEDYFRLLDKVGSPQRAIMLSAEETTSLLIFSILIIMISFIPIFLMEGAEKQIS
jgi:cobalt-zinc-cadmium resistance protein CzcA